MTDHRAQLTRLNERLETARAHLIACKDAIRETNERCRVIKVELHGVKNEHANCDAEMHESIARSVDSHLDVQRAIEAQAIHRHEMTTVKVDCLKRYRAAVQSKLEALNRTHEAYIAIYKIECVVLRVRHDWRREIHKDYVAECNANIQRVVSDLEWDEWQALV